MFWLWMPPGAAAGAAGAGATVPCAVGACACCACAPPARTAPRAAAASTRALSVLFMPELPSSLGPRVLVLPVLDAGLELLLPGGLVAHLPTRRGEGGAAAFLLR